MKWEQKGFSNGVLEIQANSWKGFAEYVQDELVDYQGYIYRGQKEPRELLSKMDRIIREKKNDSSINSTRRVFRQVDVLQNFKYASRGKRGPSPTELNENSWWALGQHYGLETPLLDWTESPFVAAFFAFVTPKVDISSPRIIYAIHRSKIEKKSQDIKQKNPGTILGGTKTIEIVSPLVDDNSRLSSQKGLFTKSLSLNLEIENWVKKQFNGIEEAIMIKIPIIEKVNDRESFLRFLNKMNINYLTLFPDLLGAAMHCNMQLEIDEY